MKRDLLKEEDVKGLVMKIVNRAEGRSINFDNKEGIVNSDILILYKDSDLNEIKTNLDNAILRFKLNDNNLIFSKSGSYLVERIENKYLGLAYNSEEHSFILNYPHISNKRESDIIENGYIEPKYNGTNYGYLVDEKGNRYFRTRGSVNPDLFLNNINSAIVKNDNMAGIKAEVFDEFKKKYNPIFEEGKSKGYIDTFGNFTLKNVNEILKSKLDAIIDNNINGFHINGRKIVGIFGELISPYNPIAIDENIKYGQYLSLGKDFEFVIFDILVYMPEGIDYYGNKYEGFYEFLQPNMISILINEDEYIKRVEYEELSSLDSLLDKYNAEEGLVIKTEDKYLKYKREDVMEWERMMGKIFNVLKFSIQHIVSELGFSKEEVISTNVYSSKQYINEVKVSIWNEIKSYNISKEDLLYFYKSESKMYDEFDSVFQDNILTGISSVLASNGIPKEKLYLEIPKYYYFNSNPLTFDEKRGKFIPISKDYARMISRIIGRVY